MCIGIELFGRVRSMGLVVLAMVSIGVGSAQGQSIAAAQHRVVLSAPNGEFDSGLISVDAIGHWSYSDVDVFGRLTDFTADGLTSGGQSPSATVQAALIGGLTFGANCEATMSYFYRIMPVGGSTRTAVPLIISAHGDASATASSSSANTLVTATARVFHPGSSSNLIINELAGAQLSSFVNNPHGSFNVTRSTVVAVGSAGRVDLRAFATLVTDAEIVAFSDPTFVIDPEATYEEDGVIYRYADEFMIEYSEGVDQFVRCPADLNGDGELDFLDISQFLNELPDLTGDTAFDFLDISEFLKVYTGGCP